MRELRAVVLIPLATVAAGDEENGTALQRRATQRGITLDVTTVHAADRVPAADIYLLGGGGDITRLVEQLRASPEFTQAVQNEVVVLAVDAGMDAIGHGSADGTGRIQTPGLGLIDVTAVPGTPADGVLVTAATAALALPALVGWVSHNKVMMLGDGVEPFAQVASGPGAGGSDGCVAGHVVGTRLHGPLLARNPEVSDLLLAWATGVDPLIWPHIEPGAAEAARAQRIAEEAQRHPSLLARLAAVAGRSRS